MESLAGSLWGDVRNNVCGCERKPCILLLYPINITAGVGCRKQISKELFEKGLNDVLEGYGLEPTQLKQLASIDLKKEEPAILAYAQKYKVPFATYPAEQLEKITEVSATSRFVKQVIGVDNVCERAARTVICSSAPGPSPTTYTVLICSVPLLPVSSLCFDPLQFVLIPS